MILVWQPAAAPNCCTQELLHIVHSIPTNPAEYSSAHWTSPSIMQSFEMQQQWKTVWNSDTPLYRKVTLDCIEKQQEGLIVSPQLLHQSTLCLLWIWQMKFALKALVRWQYLLQSVNEKSQPDTIRSKRKLAHLWNLVCCWSRKVMLPPVLLLNLWWCLAYSICLIFLFSSHFPFSFSSMGQNFGRSHWKLCGRGSNARTIAKSHGPDLHHTVSCCHKSIMPKLPIHTFHAHCNSIPMVNIWLSIWPSINFWH